VLKLACQFHTIIASLYILMYKEIQHLGRWPFQIWKKTESQILNLVDNAAQAGKIAVRTRRGPNREKFTAC
jgi:hypothetical protein